MKHQQIQLASKRNFIRIMALVAMLAVMVCGMILAVSADTAAEPTSDIRFEDGYWVKTYDGKTNVAQGDLSVINQKFNGTVLSAEFESANAGETWLKVTYQVNPTDGAKTEKFPAKILPKLLTWKDTASHSVSTTYNPNAVNGLYNVEVSTPSVDQLNGFVNGDEAAISIDANPIKVSFVMANAGETDAYAQVKLTSQNDLHKNYTVAPLEVKAIVNPIVITNVEWKLNGSALADNQSFTYGENNWLNIKAIGYYDGNKTVELVVKYGEKNLADIVDAKDAYVLNASVANGNYTLNGVTYEKTIKVAKKVYEIVFNGREFLHKGDLVTPNGYQLVVESANKNVLIPAEILSAIKYTYNGNIGTVTEPGVYTVKASIPEAIRKNYSFTVNGSEVTTVEATMTVLRNYILAYTPDGAIVIVGENGISDSVKATLSIPTEFARKAIRGLKAYNGYTLTITGAEAGDKFSIRIPVAADLIAKKNCLPMSIDNLYIYDATAGTKAVAKDTYTVTLSADRSYYIIEGYAPAGEITFMLAPDFDIPFWGSAIGIALIILIALIVLVVIPIFVGMKLVQIENSGRNPVISVETEGNVPEVEPVEIPDLIEDPDAILEESVEDLAAALVAEVAAEEAEVEADATEAVAEAMEDLNAEVAEIDLGNADGALDEMADQIALDLAEQVEAEDGSDVSDEVKQAVADAMAENFNESADATDAIALVEDEEIVPEAVEEPVIEEAVAEESAPEAEESDDDEEESFGGFGSMPLDYIDAVVEAERYAEMLEQERRGEVQLVTRYRRSYLSRLAQSQGSIQDYYNAIKNLLLSYKGVKSRISWNFESFNVGRTPLAKFNAKTRTLYVYIAFSPEELVDTKYNFTDMSAKKKYAAVPVLLKVKGERKFKHALELFTKLCEEKLQLPKKKTFEEVDYRMPFKTTEELVNEGIIKMMVAAVPVAAPEAEEAAIEEAPVVEETIIEEVPAEEAIVEEATIEEAPAEEAIVEEAAIEEAPAEEATVEEVVAEEAVEDNDQNA